MLWRVRGGRVESTSCCPFYEAGEAGRSVLAEKGAPAGQSGGNPRPEVHDFNIVRSDCFRSGSTDGGQYAYKEWALHEGAAGIARFLFSPFGVGDKHFSVRSVVVAHYLGFAFAQWEAAFAPSVGVSEGFLDGGGGGQEREGTSNLWFMEMYKGDVPFTVLVGAGEADSVGGFISEADGASHRISVADAMGGGEHPGGGDEGAGAECSMGDHFGDVGQIGGDGAGVDSSGVGSSAYCGTHGEERRSGDCGKSG